jgi:hypothetical protein
MRHINLLSLLALLILAASTASAQDGYVTGNYKLMITIGTTTYRVGLSGYQITDTKAGHRLSMKMPTAIAKAAGITPLLKGKRVVTATLYKPTATGTYHSFKMTDVMISSFTDIMISSLRDGTSTTVLQFDLGGQDLEIISPRDPQSGLPTGLREFSFGGQDLELGGQDWD